MRIIKTKEYLICIDSDGCAMDTMDIKHFNCFGPKMVEEWSLDSWRDAILSRWNDINLYKITRGINRFKGLCIALSEINEKYTNIDGLDELLEWEKNAFALSEDSLIDAISKNPTTVILKKALNWSREVNKSIVLLPKSDMNPFQGVKEALKLAHGVANIAIVSSANRQAVLEEWTMHGLLEYTDIMMTQDVGSKQSCINKLLTQGYKAENVLMIGDAEGDLTAATNNDVLYFPILVRHEAESWKEFSEKACKSFINNEYKGSYQDLKIKQFLDNFK